MNVAGYVRVSGENQIENYSIPQQKKFLEDYCNIKGWDLIKIYVDAGYTGANIQRPAMQELIEDIAVYDIVLVYRLDRLSRSQKDTLYLIDVFKENNCKFASIYENFDTTTPLGMAMLGIMSAFAQLERETIKERMAIGRKGRIQKGLWRAGSNIPTGYDYIDGRLVIREDEAIQIRTIFDLYLKGWSINKIRHYMHDNYTNRYSSWARPTSIINTLNNTIYIGMLPSKTDNTDYQGIHEPIIDIEVYKQVQQLMKARKENYDGLNPHPFKALHLLTGIIYCGECGGRISCRSSHQRAYYGCYNPTNRIDARNVNNHKCATPKYNTKKLDKIIIDEVLSLAYDETALKARIKPRKVADHSKTIKTLEKQKSRLIDLYSVGGIELSELQKKINNITARIKVLKADKPQEPELNLIDTKMLLENAKDIFGKGDDLERQRAILQSLIKKIVINGDAIEIYWRFE